jgi:GTPase SAR1 family protein
LYNKLKIFNRNAELLEKAKPGIVIALCGNKVDLDERQVSSEVKEFLN